MKSNIYSFAIKTRGEDQEQLQRFSEVTDHLGMAISSVTPENPLLWAFLMENFNLGIAKMSVISENPVFPNPVLPKTTVLGDIDLRWRCR